MKPLLIGLSLFVCVTNGYGFAHLIDQLPTSIKRSDFWFVVETSTQKNYLFYNQTLLDVFNVSTGSKTRYKGNREMPEGIWRLTKRMDGNLAPIYGARLIYLERFDKKENRFKYTNRAFHGTNEPHNIGKPTSMGCVYHYDHDIIYLYSFIPYDTLVISVKSI